MAKDHVELLVRVTGRVQGVNYRAWTRATAEALGLTGWVRNERDGSVTALVAGPEPEVLQLVEAMWEGPAAAAVANVATEAATHGERPARFRIAR